MYYVTSCTNNSLNVSTGNQKSSINLQIIMMVYRTFFSSLLNTISLGGVAFHNNGCSQNT